MELAEGYPMAVATVWRSSMGEMPHLD